MYNNSGKDYSAITFIRDYENLYALLFSLSSFFDKVGSTTCDRTNHINVIFRHLLTNFVTSVPTHLGIYGGVLVSVSVGKRDDISSS